MPTNISFVTTFYTIEGGPVFFLHKGLILLFLLQKESLFPTCPNDHREKFSDLKDSYFKKSILCLSDKYLVGALEWTHSDNTQTLCFVGMLRTTRHPKQKSFFSFIIYFITILFNCTGISTRGTQLKLRNNNTDVHLHLLPNYTVYKHVG